MSVANERDKNPIPPKKAIGEKKRKSKLYTAPPTTDLWHYVTRAQNIQPAEKQKFLFVERSKPTKFEMMTTTGE